MKKTWLISPILAVAGLSLLATGCVVREEVGYRGPRARVEVAAPVAEVEVGGAPPAPVVETMTVAPDPGFVWITGAYMWRGGGWVWESGHWARPPRVGAVWVPHHYYLRNGRHVFVRGYWR